MTRMTNDKAWLNKLNELNGNLGRLGRVLTRTALF